MITTSSESNAYRTIFSSGAHKAIADAPVAKGGGGAGFDPHELLEAALATCINIVVRKRADQLAIAVDGVAVIVRLDRSPPEVVSFEYELILHGSINAEQRALLNAVVKSCPVSQTLSKQIVFREIEKP